MAGAPVMEDDRRIWRSYEDIELDANVFPEIGAAFERAGRVEVSRVGSAEARLFSQRQAVDFAREWLTRRSGEAL